MKVYADTSIIGGCYDEEFKIWSNALIHEFVIGKKLIMISDLLLQELEYAPNFVRGVIDNIDESYSIRVNIDSNCIKLAETYITEGALSNKSYSDALHIAVATLNYADVLASWNFKHIVNLDRIRIYNSINLRLGFKNIEIRSPKELINL